MNTPNAYKLGFVRMMDLLQAKADKYIKTTLMTTVKAFVNLHFPGEGTDELLNQIISDSVSKGYITVKKPTTTEYVSLTPVGFLTRIADLQYLQ